MENRSNLIDEMIMKNERSSKSLDVSFEETKSFDPPHLAVVIVGDRKDSLAYVKKKVETCQKLELSPQYTGYRQQRYHSKDVDGLHPHNMGCLASSDPLCEQSQAQSSEKQQIQMEMINEIERLGKMESHHFFSPCTAKGVVELLLRSGVTIAGSNVTVVGRSLLVGLPVSLLFTKTSRNRHDVSLKD
ncbi:uncharacterized protein LOC129618084 [Condylostylus longicornis]|uniref:uncharacterized protein LOC129618084 n=1 Tax=Condylostylus longicornis TaxID=2530218 RepID=UPI00244DE900|nr:uncharacterized protein LOC129618084 [Condylostylus longicornis]